MYELRLKARKPTAETKMKVCKWESRNQKADHCIFVFVFVVQKLIFNSDNFDGSLFWWYYRYSVSVDISTLTDNSVLTLVKSFNIESSIFNIANNVFDIDSRVFNIDSCVFNSDIGVFNFHSCIFNIDNSVFNINSWVCLTLIAAYVTLIVVYSALMVVYLTLIEAYLTLMVVYSIFSLVPQ